MTMVDTKVPEAKYEYEKDEAGVGVALALSGKTWWMIRTDKQGFEFETTPIRDLNASSYVMASITEVNNNNVPFQGAATMQIHNVVPQNQRTGEVGGRIRVRGFIGWENNLRFKVSFIIAND
jgi:hypothetical protein